MQDRKPGNQTRQSLECRGKRNIRLTLAFDGTAYHGWQIQNDSRTVQGLLSDAIARITGEQVTPTGSGRTDAGTHARGLVANFFTGSRLSPGQMRARSEQPAAQGYPSFVGAPGPSGFSCPEERRLKNISLSDVSGPDPAAPSDARIFSLPASRRPGENGPGRASVSRESTISQVLRRPTRPPPARSDASSAANCRNEGHRLFLTVEGNGFLHHMVRNMAGTLLEVGRGSISLKDFEDLFLKRDRRLAGFTAPAHGLVLLKVKY